MSGWEGHSPAQGFVQARSVPGTLFLLLLDTAKLKDRDTHRGCVVGIPSSFIQLPTQSGISPVLLCAQVWLKLDKSSIVRGPTGWKAGGVYDLKQQARKSHLMTLPYVYLCAWGPFMFLHGPDHIYGHGDQRPDLRYYIGPIQIVHF